jgi:hypothetical protein
MSFAQLLRNIDKGEYSMARHLLWAVLVFLLLSTHAPAIAAGNWESIPPELLAQKTPVIDKDADVEGIFWDVWVSSSSELQRGRPGMVVQETRNYIRLKVFTDRGKEMLSKVTIPYVNNLRYLEGRTIKPDGTILEVKSDAIFDRTIASMQQVKIKAKSFAFPGIEPGVIVEYRWAEVNPANTYTRYPLQRDIPMQTISYHIKPLTGVSTNLGMSTATFNCPQVKMVKEGGGYAGFQIHNVPALKEEPQMPPADTIRAFLLVFYRGDVQQEPDKYWRDYGKSIFERSKYQIHPNDDDVKKATAEAIGNSTQPDEKLDKIYLFVQTKIKNILDDAFRMPMQQRMMMLQKSGVSMTLQRGSGGPNDIRDLFISMVSAAGFETRYAMSGNRADFFFQPSFADQYFLNNMLVAVKVNDQWKFFDPTSKYLPSGMLPWGLEQSQALISDNKEPVFVTTPLSPLEKSLEKRTAKLQLTDSGTLEGDVTIEYTGHLGAFRKEFNDNEPPPARWEILRNQIKARLNDAEITNIRLENVTDREKPFIYHFHIRVPNYAQRTGKRMFFQPTFFQKGLPPMFSSNQRKYKIYFEFPWMENDEVEIKLPDGYQLEAAGAPQPIDAGGISRHELNITIANDRRTLLCNRKFFFGGKGGILYDSKDYPSIKQLFDRFHDADNQSLILKQTTDTQ